MVKKGALSDSSRLGVPLLPESQSPSAGVQLDMPLVLAGVGPRGGPPVTGEQTDSWCHTYSRCSEQEEGLMGEQGCPDGSGGRSLGKPRTRLTSQRAFPWA